MIRSILPILCLVVAFFISSTCQAADYSVAINGSFQGEQLQKFSKSNGGPSGQGHKKKFRQKKKHRKAWY